jgi:hypothetical protein
LTGAADGGEANSNWKGGRTRHKAGYVMVKTVGHPRGGRGGYVFEHILIAEEILGRHLEAGESIHHRNGVKDDNHPENLELWTRPQPTGIRVSDAIEWARSILDLHCSDDRPSPPTALWVAPERSWDVHETLLTWEDGKRGSGAPQVGRGSLHNALPTWPDD